ncbi:MAG: ABC transporter permease, partial [Acidobacteriota bacterium]|nr:ABC transporter permease [Acidobacteriota bacterium]
SRAYFDMLGVPPVVGRTFTNAEDAPGVARRVVVLSHGLWRRRFAENPAVVGRPILIGGIPHTVIGVMPAWFEDLVSARLYRGAELWYPLGYDPAASFACRTCRHLRVFGRLAPGVAPEAAARELSSVFGALEREHPNDYHEAGAAVTPLSEFFLGPVRPVLLVLWAGVALLLVVACGNVANLLLLRASERTHEMAVRTALGVTRGRLARQLLTESLLLALLGGVSGLLPAWLAVRALRVVGPIEIPRMADVALDGRAVAVACGVAAVSGVICGVMPLLQLLRRGASERMHGAGRRTESAATWRVRAALVAGNVALAALLLVGSGLLVRSLATLLAEQPGFDASRSLTMEVVLGGARYAFGNQPEKEIADAVRFYDDVLRRVAALPEVESAGATTTLPLGGGHDRSGLHIEGRPSPNPEAAPSADRFAVTPRFLETLRIPLVRGRLLNDRDAQGAESVAVINRTLADELFAGQDPLGHRVRLGPPDALPRTIVGVVGDVRHEGLHVPPGYQVYVPQAQWAWAETRMTIVVRARGARAASLAGPVRAIVRDIDPEQPVTAIRPYDDIVAASTGTRRFAASLLGLFAATALLMAVVGLYGALAVLVGQRRREIGVRVALGAGAAQIRCMVLVHGVRPAVAGLAVGLLAAAASVRVLASLLYGVQALDPATFVTAALTLLACVVAACLIPAWRAAQVDPVSALRAE